MAVFLVVDPDGERRTVLKILLGVEHRLAESKSIEDSLLACRGQAFDAVFVAWPDGDA